MHLRTRALLRMEKAKMSKSKLKAMLIVLFGVNNIVMIKWVPEGQTENQTYYLKVLATLGERVYKKWPELWKNKSWILHQDNAPVLVPRHYNISIMPIFGVLCPLWQTDMHP